MAPWGHLYHSQFERTTQQSLPQDPLRKLCSPSLLSLQLSSSFGTPRDPLVLGPSFQMLPGTIHHDLAHSSRPSAPGAGPDSSHSTLAMSTARSHPPCTISLFFPLPPVPTETQGQPCFQALGTGRVQGLWDCSQGPGCLNCQLANSWIPREH